MVRMVSRSRLGQQNRMALLGRARDLLERNVRVLGA